MRVIDFHAGKLMTLARARKLIDPFTADMVSRMSDFFSCIDRTGTLDLGVRSLSLQPIPTGHTTKSLEEICDDTARALIAENRPMAVYWSGGIDSTLVLISLLKAGVPQDQLTVVTTPYSVAEYPWFYRQYIQDKLAERRVGTSVFPHIRTDELIVTGEHGDQIMGSNKIGLYQADGRFAEIWTDTWEDAALRMLGDAHAVEFYAPLVAQCPFPITRAYDFFWWTSFTLKWQHVMLRMTTSLDGITDYLTVVRHFYAVPDFQRWSMDEQNHRTLKCGDTYASYKHEMKRLIRDFTNDDGYYTNKLKVGSLPTTSGKPFLLLLEDGRRVCFGEDSSRPEVFERVYGRGRFKEAFGIEIADLFTGVQN